MKKLLISLLLLCTLTLKAEDGSRLWLRHATDAQARIIPSAKPSATLQLAINELQQGWQGLPVRLEVKKAKKQSPEGFTIRTTPQEVIITSPTDRGLLYGAYHLLRLQAEETTGGALSVSEEPAFELRILNHWDNLDGTVERGYAGRSLWDWETLPTLSPRYEAYARANASIGINGTVLNNVNASPQILTADYLAKVKALADLFRPYGIRVYLSVNFASPMVLDGLATADPLEPAVIKWWKQKANEIYRLIPDFGGFLVKANSEGQPGPCDFGRTHAEGANMLADVLKPHKGIVMWRAFVYNANDADRAKQAYQEFKPLDGEFRPNVIIQVKNGPVDFQPREPYSPLFGAMQTPLMPELQITQEYLGHSNHIAYLAPMWEEFFRFVNPASMRAIAGVSNIGTDSNWCGYTLAQSNWYAFGRLAWNPTLTSSQIAREWIAQTYALPAPASQTLEALLMQSREAVVNYMMPLGLHHLFAWGHHYGPEPWCAIPGARPDWMPSYYHNASSAGIGFNRSSSGSQAVAQYPEPLRQLYDNPRLCPDEYLLWFHHLPWDFKMKNGHTLWQELCYRYDHGVKQVRRMQHQWESLQPYIDAIRFAEAQSKLKTQLRDAIWWKDACLLYFQQFSKQPFPAGIELPIYQLEQLKQVQLGIDNYTNPDARLLDSKR